MHTSSNSDESVAVAAPLAGGAQTHSIRASHLRRLLIPALLLALFAMQGMWFIGTQSFSWDEPLHLNAGLEELRTGSFKFIPDHPPLAHVLSAAPLAHDRGVQMKFLYKPWISIDLLSVTPNPEFLAWRSRLPILLLGLLLGVLLWRTARTLFSEGAANLALALFAFSPALIAHYSMVTTDGVVTLAYFATAVQLVRWRKDPSWKQTSVLGVLLGLLLLSKLNAPVLVMLAMAFVLIEKGRDWHEIRRWRWRKAIAAGMVAFFVLWAGYFFHVSHYTTQHGTLFITFPPDPKPVPVNIVMEHDLNLWVPAGEYVYGFLQTMHHNSGGHAKFLLGNWSSGYMPTLFPTEIALKWPPVVLLLFGSSVVLIATRRIKLPPGSAVYAVFPLAILFLAMSSRIASGERHLLPAYPFVLLFAAAAWHYARANVRHGKILACVLLLAVAANAADVLRYAPDYLSYFNPLVDSRKSYRLLSFSDLDWGQGLVALKKYQAAHPDENLYLATVGITKPEVYGIRATELPPNEFHSGTIVVSASRMAGFNAGDSCGYCWLHKYPLKTMLNHSLFVYEVPPVSVPDAK